MPEQIFKFILPFVIWPAFATFIGNGVNVSSIKSLIAGYILPLNSPGAAMWFLKVLGIMMIIIGYIKNKKQLIIIDVIFGLTFLLGLLLSSYSGLMQNTTFGNAILGFYYSHWSSTRNFLFSGWLILTGYTVKEFNLINKINKKYSSMAFLFAFVISVFEWMLQKNVIISTNGFSFYFISPILCASLLLILLQNNKQIFKSTNLVRELSTGIYYCHMTLIVIFNQILLEFSLTEDSILSFSVVKFIIIAVVSGLLTYLARKSNSKLLKLLF